MRLIIFVALILILTVEAKAQNNLQRTYFNNSKGNFIADSTQFNTDRAGTKWFVSKYSGISTGIGFFNGGSTNFFAAPIVLQLNRRLSNNLYAFAAISAVPAYIGFNNSNLFANTSKFVQNNSILSLGNFNMYPKAEMGLMYINDQKTFFISGSISVEKSNYLFAPVNQFGIMRANTFNAVR